MKTMNNIKKALSLLLVFALFLVMIPVPALAAETDGTDCTHKFNTTIVAPTCTDEGYTLYACEFCPESYLDNYTDPVGHNYSTSIVAATCTEDGYTLYDCTECDDSYTETIPATGHDIATTVVAPTCTEDGYTVHVCNNCDLVNYDAPVNALGHTYTSTVVAPTCDAYGYTKHTCTDCGCSYTTDSVIPLGHTYTVRVFAGETIYTCTSCGHSYVKEDPGLNYKYVSKFTHGESYVIAVYYGRTAYALSHAGNQISAVKITIADGKVKSTVSEDMLWTYSGGKLSFEANGTTYYLRANGSGSGYIPLSLSTTAYSNVSISNDKLRVGNYYLRFNGGTIKGYRSGGTTYLMEET